MFTSQTYTKRREKLKGLMKSGIALFLGNPEASFNYPANTYHFRQDSSFSYFFGLNHPDLAGIVDFDSGEDIIFGNDVDMDDIIWMGPQPSIKDRAAEVGVTKTFQYNGLLDYVKKALNEGRTVHFLPPYRGETYMELERLTGIHHTKVKEAASVELIQAVVALRSVKEDVEIVEIEKMVDVAYEMHTTAMKMAHPGIKEQEIVGAIEGIAISYGGAVSFPIILSINGQTLHNHAHGNFLNEGRMMVTDAGAENEMYYSSDITRTVPVGGKFTDRQKDVYNAVLKANMAAIEMVKPGVLNRDIHLHAAEVIATDLKAMGLMKGDVKEAVKQGAHALFFPHGLGHMMGMDVHDLEGVGENYVGYDDEIKRSDQFGLAFLRMGRRLQEGFVITIEPGCYFIPALIDQWKAEKKFEDFINYAEVEKFKDFGGIRIEDDILVTADSFRVLGKPIPKTVEEIEAIMKK